MDEFFDFDRAATATDQAFLETSRNSPLPFDTAVDLPGPEAQDESITPEHFTTSVFEQQLYPQICENDDHMKFSGSWPSSAEDNQACQPTGGIESPSQAASHGPKSSRESFCSSSDHLPQSSGKFSRESLRVLRAWMSSHHRYPYPSEEDKEHLKEQTSLSKSQIVNWMANTRRKGRARAPLLTLAPVMNLAVASPVDIPRRPTPAIEQMNPFERWKHSPPESEPASAAAIARAINSSAVPSPYEGLPSSTYVSHVSVPARSIFNDSSTSSIGVSNSSHSSSSSAFSHGSRASFRSFAPSSGRRPRRRCRQALQPTRAIRSTSPPRTFQCTFCTETFKSKYDWQRHEKSLYLSLERWICTPNGVTSLCIETNLISCVYCGLANPDHEHIELHDQSTCFERSIEERTFYRKDHLRQHLALVHDSKFQKWSMEDWKATTPAIRSRCGFCDIIMDSWKTRADHLADHFKSGQSMAEWQGDWGFESHVLDLVENGMPPCKCFPPLPSVSITVWIAFIDLIHTDRLSLLPFKASIKTPETRRILYDLVKMGLVDFMNDQLAFGKATTNFDVVNEARRICNTIDGAADGLHRIGVSRFRDLFLRSTQPGSLIDPVIFSQKYRKIDTSGAPCPKERKLREFVDGCIARGHYPTNFELQTEASRILAELETVSSFPCAAALSWFYYLINSSASWLEEFRQRSHLPCSPAPVLEDLRSCEGFIGYNTSSHAHSEEVAEKGIISPGCQAYPTTNSPMDSVTALWWDLTYSNDSTMSDTGNPIRHDSSSSTPFVRKALRLYPQVIPIAPSDASTRTNANPHPRYFFSDANCYQRLKHELSRFVMSCISPNNPARHVPTDDEIRNQARWIIFDADDPWNQTAADNAGWLLCFKRDVGLLDLGPELIPGSSWHYG